MPPQGALCKIVRRLTRALEKKSITYPEAGSDLGEETYPLSFPAGGFVPCKVRFGVVGASPVAVEAADGLAASLASRAAAARLSASISPQQCAHAPCAIVARSS